MNLLLDTHVLLWWLADDATLSDGARQAIADSDRLVYVSAVTAWEISIKSAIGKLDAPDELDDAIATSGFDTLPVTFAHGLAAGRLPRIHSDPFDRMLVAQAAYEGLTLITRDEHIAEYPIPTIKG